MSNFNKFFEILGDDINKESKSIECDSLSNCKEYLNSERFLFSENSEIKDFLRELNILKADLTNKVAKMIGLDESDDVNFGGNSIVNMIKRNSDGSSYSARIRFDTDYLENSDEYMIDILISYSIDKGDTLYKNSIDRAFEISEVSIDSKRYKQMISILKQNYDLTVQLSNNMEGKR